MALTDDQMQAALRNVSDMRSSMDAQLDPRDVATARRSFERDSGPKLRKDEELFRAGEDARASMDATTSAPSPLAPALARPMTTALTPEQVQAAAASFGPVKPRREVAAGEAPRAPVPELVSDIRVGQPQPAGMDAAWAAAQKAAAPQLQMERTPPPATGGFDRSQFGPATGVGTGFQTAPTEATPQGMPATGAPPPMQLQMPAPVQYHPGGFDYSRVPIEAPIRNAQLANLDAQAEAARNAGLTESVGHQQLAEAHAQQMDRLREQAANRAAHEAANQAKTADMMRRQQDLSTKVTEESIDGSRYWKNPSNVLASFASAFSAFGHNPQNAYDITRKAVERDIDAQKEDIKNRQFNRQEQRQNLNNLYNMHRDQIGDQRMADVAAEADINNQAAIRLRAIGEQIGTQSARDAAEQMALKFDERKLALMGQFSQMAHFAPYQTGGGAVDKDVHTYAQELIASKIPQAEAEIEALKRGLPAPGQPIPGTGTWNDILAKLPMGERVFFNDKERINRQNVDRIKLKYRQAITGAGGSDAEAAKIDKAFDGAGTPAELWNAIGQGDEAIKSQKRTIQAGHKKQTVDAFNERLKTTDAPPMPGTVRTK